MDLSRSVTRQEMMGRAGGAARAPAALALPFIRDRNIWLDQLFYDVDAITLEERAGLRVEEGHLLVVPPSGQGPLEVFPSVEAFRASGQSVKALAVAGVGSSALGAAAFARDVADGVDGPALAVVSGYGVADVWTEALGGWFLFGRLNSLRHLFQLTVARNRRARDMTIASEHMAEFVDGVSLVRTSPDTQAILTLLKDPAFEVPLLVGHSKGNLVISEALYALCDEAAKRARTLAEKTRIITISAMIEMPVPFWKVTDIIGDADWLGEMNSRWGLKPDLLVPGAGHSTNPHLCTGWRQWLGEPVLVPEAVRTACALPFPPKRPLPKVAHWPMGDAPQRFSVMLRQFPFSLRAQ